MQAKETKLQDILEGTKQYVIPLFQRTYSWTKQEWEILWADLMELCETENPRTHFIGSIVSMPTISVPEGVAKFLLIDGQQRLTTIFILLTLIRNKARESQRQDLAEEINNTLLVNPYKKDGGYFKLMPTQYDREAYTNLVYGKSCEGESQITQAYTFFEKKLKQLSIEHDRLKKILTSYFSVVSIVLDTDDNPYLVFESLNAKGRPLTQADLIRNYFFMRIHINSQDEVYTRYWQPMQTALKESLTEYIRHFLMRDGNIIKQNDVYYSLKEKVSSNNAIDYLKELNKYSVYYEKLLNPENEHQPELQKYLWRLNRIEVTTAYPLLLSIYGIYDEKRLCKDDFLEILQTLENYLIRRFVCKVPSNQLNKIFPTVCVLLSTTYQNNIVKGLKELLQSRGYPKDIEFFNRFKDAKFYGAGDRQLKTKLILETFEESFAHKEVLSFDCLTIEHVMPQTLSEWWKTHLGENWEETHELYLHTIGNLTLTGYNSELSNDDYPTKQLKYIDSHLELNKYFTTHLSWSSSEIELRSEELANSALKIWSYFGEKSSTISDTKQVTGKTPVSLIILGQQFNVSSWRDVLELTFNTIADLEPDKFLVIAQSYPYYLGLDKNKFRAVRQLQNGYFIEVNLSAQSIQKICSQAIDTADLTTNDWIVNVK